MMTAMWGILGGTFISIVIIIIAWDFYSSVFTAAIILPLWGVFCLGWFIGSISLKKETG